MKMNFVGTHEVGKIERENKIDLTVKYCQRILCVENQDVEEKCGG